MLAIRGLCAGYGSAQVLHGVDLHVDTGEMVALVGANGAGKSTLLKAISGLLRAEAGSIALDGSPIDSLAPVARVRLGLAHVPEGRQIFGALTVRENVRLGTYSVLRNLSAHAYHERFEKVVDVFPALREKLDLPAGGLSGGQQQMLAIARGLMLAPRVLLLDEPSLGLSPLLVTEIFRVLRSLRDLGTAILLSEQNARLSLAIADRGYVLETGKIVSAGTGRDLLTNADVMERYLGIDAAGPHVAHDRTTSELTQRLKLLLS